MCYLNTYPPSSSLHIYVSLARVLCFPRSRCENTCCQGTMDYPLVQVHNMNVRFHRSLCTPHRSNRMALPHSPPRVLACATAFANLSYPFGTYRILSVGLIPLSFSVRPDPRGCQGSHLDRPTSPRARTGRRAGRSQQGNRHRQVGVGSLGA